VAVVTVRNRGAVPALVTVTILVGQAGGRLRVHRLRMDDARRTPPGRVPVTAEQGEHR
jgi:hypothetical protein